MCFLAYAARLCSSLEVLFAERFHSNGIGFSTGLARLATNIRIMVINLTARLRQFLIWSILSGALGPSVLMAQDQTAVLVGKLLQPKIAASQEQNETTTSQPQNPTAAPARNKKVGDAEPMSLKSVFLNLPGDQKTIWTAPFRLKASDSTWLVPFGGTLGVLVASDERNMLRLHSDASAISLSNNVANAGTVALAGVPATMYVFGTLNGSARWRETGLLTGEGLVNSWIVNEAIGRALGRERPTTTDGQGRFFQQFSNPSFPSDHSMLSWTAASIIAHEYPGWLSQGLAYGTASAVSVARVTGREHFPSDVVAGAALGWLIGRQVYRAHHDPDIDGGAYGTFVSEKHPFAGPQTGTTFVPIDSWVYPAFDQLAALGFVRSGAAGLRPWTRSECARLVAEAETFIDPDAHDLPATTVRALANEFAVELDGSQNQPYDRIDEIYTRAGYVSGQPLADDYHFAKTFTDDFGRPFGTGANSIAGVSTRAVVGPLAFYVRGEYQHAGTLAAQPAAAQQAIANLESLPFAPPQRTQSVDQLRFLDAYVAFNFHNNIISFGQQTLWWGPGADGPFLASNNAQSLPMLRISRATPFVLPWLFRLMGPIRLEAFWSQLGGQEFVSIVDSAGNNQVIGPALHPHPALQGAKFSFKPTSNLEFGFDETAIFSGPGFPLTLHSLLRSYSPGNTIPGAAADPGDRRSAFDFSYRLPGLRKWLTLYSDSFTEDEISPVSFPRKSSFRAGLYAPQLPKLPRLDLRVEGIYTDIPNLHAIGNEYSNAHYISGYTNYGQIIGNAIGREGRGLNAWTTYRFSPTSNIQIHYRSQHVNPEFLEGGYLRDYDATGTFGKVYGLVISGTFKYEHWNFPLLSAVPKTNVSAALQVSFRPLRGWGQKNQK